MKVKKNYKKKFLNKLINYFFYLFFCTPLLIILVILSPIKFIRVYRFNYRVGHFSEDLFLYLCKKNQESKNCLDLFYIDDTDGKINLGLLLLAKENGLILLPKFLISNFYFYIKILSIRIKFLKNFLAYERNSKKDGYQFFDKNLKIKIPQKIIEEGDKFFNKINPENRKVVCLNLWSSKHLLSNKDLDWSHHDFRYSNFDSYIKSIEHLTKEGFLVIKIGRSNEECFIKDNPYFIDYSFNHANDYLDIALVNKCYAYISNATGLDHLSFSFNKPMLINCSNIHDLFVERNNILYLLRPYYSNIKNKYLSLREIIQEFNLAFIFKNQDFKAKQIIIKNNIDNELLLATKDLMFLIKNQFILDRNLKILSDKFFNYFIIAKEKHKKDLNYYKNTHIKSYYSWSVIKENENWIE